MLGNDDHNGTSDPGEKLERYGAAPLDKKMKDYVAESDSKRLGDRRANAPTSAPIPRIAVTDPLHDMRSRNVSRPDVGLSEKSDLPPRSRDSSRPLSRRNSDASSADSESGIAFDEFDWSDDEGVEEALRTEKEEQAMARKKRSRHLSPWSIGRWLFTSFLGNFLLSCIIVTPAIVMQFVYRNESSPSNRAHRDYVTDNVQAWTIWAAFNLFMSWVFHILVEIFPRFVMAAISLVWGRNSQAVLSAVEYYNAQKGYIKPMFYAACSWGSFAILFNSIFGLYNHANPEAESRAPYLYRLYQVIEFFFFLVLTLCVEKIIIKNIALSFHQSAFAERIADVTKSLETFDHLKDYRPKLKESTSTLKPFNLPRHLTGRSGSAMHSGQPSPAVSPGVEDTQSDAQGADTSFGSDSSQRGFFNRRKHSNKRAQNVDPDLTHTSDAQTQYPPKAGIAHPRKAFKKVNKARGDAVRSFKLKANSASKLARIAMQDPLTALQSEKAGGIADINSAAEAKKLAKSIFNAFRGRRNRTYLVLSDFEPAFPTHEQAKEAFGVFDKDGNGDISQTEIKNTMLSVYKERRHLMKAIGDTNHAVAQLDLIFVIIACIIIIFEAFAIFNVNIGSSLTTFYTLGIAFAFVFKESAQNVFESIIFIFVTHPMDTGDRIQLGDAVMVVTKMSLLSSEFTLWDGTDIYVANSVLSNMMMINHRRSNYAWENFVIQVDLGTSLDQIDAVERDMNHWLQTEPERMFEPSTAMVPLQICYQRYMEISVGMTHRVNWSSHWGERWRHRSAFGAALSYFCKKHGVRYFQPAQPIVHLDSDAGSQPERRPQAEVEDAHVAEEEEEDPYYVLDDFSPVVDSTAGSLSANTSSAIAPKRPNYMGFTPPMDEDASTTRMRKSRKKGFANQGGDG